MTWFIDLRASPVGGGVRPAPLIYNATTLKLIADLQAAIRNRNIIFATHGFNVTAADGRATLSAWQSWLPMPAGGVFIAVLWPGDSTWAHGLDYPVEGNDAMASGNLLAAFIAAHLGRAASLSFASHSLGARMVLQTVARLARPVKHLMLMAGAIDDTCLDGEYAAAAQWVEQISILASAADTVLEYAFPIGNLAAGIVSQGAPYWHAALGREGPQSTAAGNIVPGWQLPPDWAFDHHDYLAATPASQAPLAIPVAFPAATDPPPFDNATLPDWRPAWSAAITATRFRP